jgi:carboxyl-terminal processing protease
MESETYRASSDEAYDLPMVVLVDPYSASAAEIVAGALQDHDRALVVGNTSYGKGSVQSLFRLSGGNFLKMTTGKWYTPVGRSIQKPIHAQNADPHADPDSAAADTASTDTTKRRPDRTEGGRTVQGGRGRVHEVTGQPDTTTLAERSMITAVSKKASVFNDVMMRYAVEYERRAPNLTRDFRITPEMHRELFNRLRTAGVELTWEQFEGGHRLIDARLVNEIAISRFGPAVAAQRNDPDDYTLQQAVRLLQGAETQAALFQAAQRLQPVAAAPR